MSRRLLSKQPKEEMDRLGSFSQTDVRQISISSSSVAVEYIVVICTLTKER